MGTLSTDEKDALEDVFSAIHSKNDSFNIIKHFNYNMLNSFKVAKIGAKNTKFDKFSSFFKKKKKNLSK